MSLFLSSIAYPDSICTAAQKVAQKKHLLQAGSLQESVQQNEKFSKPSQTDLIKFLFSGHFYMVILLYNGIWI